MANTINTIYLINFCVSDVAHGELSGGAGHLHLWDGAGCQLDVEQDDPGEVGVVANWDTAIMLVRWNTVVSLTVFQSYWALLASYSWALNSLYSLDLKLKITYYI